MDLRSFARTSLTASRRRRLAPTLFVAALVALALVVSVVSLAVAAPTSFPDVPSSHPYYAAINHLADRSIISGKTDGKFYPGDSVTRQQFAKMVVLTGDYPVSEADLCPFADVEVSGPGELFPDNYVAVCAARGITLGTSATTFSPYASITRLQVVSMVVRAADDLQPGLLAPPPAGWLPSGTWALDATHGANAVRAEYNGLLDGLDLASLVPTGFMTRGEVAQILHNLLLKLTPPTTTTVAPTTSSSTTSTTSSSTTTSTVIPWPYPEGPCG